MNAEETARLCGLVASVCPQQQMVASDPKQNEPGTAAYWWPLLDDVRYVDARDAVMRLGKRQRFIAPSEIIDMVAVIRRERLDAIPEAQRPVPNVDPNDVQRYLAGRRAIEKKIADGEIRSDGDGGFVLPSAQWQHRILTGPTVSREVDFSLVFDERRRVLTEQAAARKREAAEWEAAHDAERRERERQLAALEEVQRAYEAARQGKLARKRKMSKTVKSLADSGGMMVEPQAERDAAAS